MVAHPVIKFRPIGKSLSIGAFLPKVTTRIATTVQTIGITAKLTNMLIITFPSKTKTQSTNEYRGQNKVEHLYDNAPKTVWKSCCYLRYQIPYHRPSDILM